MSVQAIWGGGSLQSPSAFAAPPMSLGQGGNIGGGGLLGKPPKEGDRNASLENGLYSYLTLIKSRRAFKWQQKS